MRLSMGSGERNFGVHMISPRDIPSDVFTSLHKTRDDLLKKKRMSDAQTARMKRWLEEDKKKEEEKEKHENNDPS